MKFRIEDNKGHISCHASTDGISSICRCEISVNDADRSWNITVWFTKEEFMNKGYGRETMQQTLSYCVNRYRSPESIKYTWNGTNEYVLDWLKKRFDAVCTCPIAVQKYQADDDWSSHIYELNKDKVLEYFKL